jgi:undecaprenyl-diphosphatase
MSISEAFFLGFLQGVTEFLPISSSGHLLIAGYFFELKPLENLIVIVFFHLATALSIMVVFWRELWEMIRDLAKLQWNENTKLICKLIISAIPIFIVGVFFEKQIAYFFEGNILLVACMLLITAGLIFLSYKTKEQKKPMSYSRSFWIGVFQAFAILPGLSRSGTTITTGILLGCDRKKVTSFSFLMLLIPVLGGSFLQFLEILEKPQTIPISSLLVGFFTAFIVGICCCIWMRKLVQKNQLIYFSFYCLALAIFLFFL